VLVDGLGRLGAAIAATLAAAGVGRVDGADAQPVRPEDVLPAGHAAADIGTPRATSLRRAVARALGYDPVADREREPARDDLPPHRQVPPDRRGAPPDLVVLVRDDAVELAAADDLVHRGLPHLAVVVAAERVVVGPLVRPGRGPCLRCVHLHRCDRDPAWPRLVAQLASAPPPAAEPCRGESASATAAAGLVCLQVLAHLDGVVPPVSWGRTLALTLPDGLVERRRWAPHPRCGCTRLPGPADQPPEAHSAPSVRRRIV
jgi:hypothetical protein